MGAIWHDSKLPSWMAAGPQFSFVDVVEIVQPAPATYEAARAQMQAWERKLGAVFYQHNAERAYEMWQLKRPWWLV